MAETDVSWCLEGPVKPLPISLPFPTGKESKQVVSLQLPCDSEQAGYTLLPAAPEPDSWAGAGTESLKSLCTHHRDGNRLCLPLAVDEDTLGQRTSTSHPFSEMAGISLLQGTKGYRHLPRSLFSFAFS